MASQLELIARPTLQVKPWAGLSEPRLWVRRFVIWSEPGSVLRDVPLRPGVNIVWSKDPAERDAADPVSDALGHGSGKTLFCRLLRYCLGEPHFAPVQQRGSIGAKLPKGLVGAEVFLEGTQWAIVRSIGIGRRHLAVPGGDLDALATDPPPSTGIDAFLQAASKTVVGAGLPTTLSGARPNFSWLAALAWLTRDQECRFDHVLAWRSPASDSDSPARGLSGAETLDVLRRLLGAISPEEPILRGTVTEAEEKLGESLQLNSHRLWEIARRRKRLATALGAQLDEFGETELGVPAFRKAARDALARAALGDATESIGGVDALETESDEAEGKAEVLRKQLAEMDASIPEIQRLVSMLKGELSSITFQSLGAEQPICPVCEVPIDRVLAEGCKLSHKLPDLKAIRDRYEVREQELANEDLRLNEVREGRDRLVAEVPIAQARAAELRSRLKKARLAADSRTAAWYSARRLLDEVDGLEALLKEQQEHVEVYETTSADADRLRDQISALRAESATVLRRLSDIFDGTVRDLVGARASGEVSLDGSGLRLAIKLGGDRSSVAIDSLKVLAFDLAALCVSMEGGSHQPAFLLHDSPREADLGLSVYRRLFRLVRALEDLGDTPLFQYIITTTTAPPPELRTKPWLALELEGEPADLRLLRCDL